jgi:hypothetical protein
MCLTIVCCYIEFQSLVFKLCSGQGKCNGRLDRPTDQPTTGWLLYTPPNFVFGGIMNYISRSIIYQIPMTLLWLRKNGVTWQCIYFAEMSFALYRHRINFCNIFISIGTCVGNVLTVLIPPALPVHTESGIDIPMVLSSNFRRLKYQIIHFTECYL